MKKLEEWQKGECLFWCWQQVCRSMYSKTIEFQLSEIVEPIQTLTDPSGAGRGMRSACCRIASDDAVTVAARLGSGINQAAARGGQRLGAGEEAVEAQQHSKGLTALTSKSVPMRTLLQP